MLAIAGGKGGCGKTTTAAGLARALAGRNANVAVADADGGLPDLHVLAEVPLSPGLPALTAGDSTEGSVNRSERFSGAAHRSERFEGTANRSERPADAAHRSERLAGATVIPAGVEPVSDVVGPLQRLDRAYDHLLVDTPAGASPGVTGPIRLADGVLLVARPTHQSLVAAAKTAAMARALDTPVLGAVLVGSVGGHDTSGLLDCPTVAHVPSVAKPLSDAGVRAAYDRTVTRVTKRNV